MSEVYILQHNDPELWEKLLILVARRKTNIKALILKLLREEVEKNEGD